METNTPILSIKHLSVAYGDKEVLHDVNLELVKGEVVAVAIIGRNGSGKSTLMKAITRTKEQYQGEIRYKNEDLRHIPTHELRKKGILYIPQNGLILPSLTVAEHFKLTGKPIEAATAFVAELKPMAKQVVANLSGGEKQLLSLALLSVQEADLWLLDEPTAGVAPERIKMIADFLIARNQEYGTTMLMIEHHTNFIKAVAQKIGKIEDGYLSKLENTATVLAY